MEEYPSARSPSLYYLILQTSRYPDGDTAKSLRKLEPSMPSLSSKLGIPFSSSPNLVCMLHKVLRGQRVYEDIGRKPISKCRHQGLWGIWNRNLAVLSFARWFRQDRPLQEPCRANPVSRLCVASWQDLLRGGQVTATGPGPDISNITTATSRPQRLHGTNRSELSSSDLQAYQPHLYLVRHNPTWQP